MKRIALLTAALALAVASPALSHHSHAMFDHAKEVAVTGTVTEFAYRNPHVLLYLDVKSDTGETVKYEIDRGMGINFDSGGRGSGQEAAARAYGSKGTGRVGALDLASPYPFTTATEHYEAWLKQARGGTRHTKITIPDWRGRWSGGPVGLDGGPNPASSVAAMLKPEYRERFVQEMKAAAEGRGWGAGAFCLPGGFFASLEAEEFIVTPDQVWALAAGNGENYIRWIYTDGSGHTPKESEFAKWHGESIAFWDRDPWRTYLDESDKRYERYRKAQGR